MWFVKCVNHFIEKTATTRTTTTAYEGARTDGNTSPFRLEQLIHEPTHNIGERSSSIYLIFEKQNYKKLKHIWYVKKAVFIKNYFIYT